MEKDYYVTVFLKAIAQKEPDIVFKGGTSLSKCYHIINRFSEDIDLNIETDSKPTQGQRACLKKNIVAATQNFGFTVQNPDEIKSRRDFNRYLIDYQSTFDTGYLKRNLIVETAVFFRTYPTRKRNATSLIYDYLNREGMDSLIAQYDLFPFEVNVQAAERTFVEQAFLGLLLQSIGENRLQSGKDSGRNRLPHLPSPAPEAARLRRRLARHTDQPTGNPAGGHGG